MFASFRCLQLVLKEKKNSENALKQYKRVYERSHIWTAEKDMEIFQALISQLLSCVYNCDDQSCLHLSPQFKYMIFHIFIYILHLLRVYYELTIWPAAPRWLYSSVGRALQRYRRSHGFESRSGLNFFQALISQLLSCLYNCDNQWCFRTEAMTGKHHWGRRNGRHALMENQLKIISSSPIPRRGYLCL